MNVLDLKNDGTYVASLSMPFSFSLPDTWPVNDIDVLGRHLSFSEYTLSSDRKTGTVKIVSSPGIQSQYNEAAWGSQLVVLVAICAALGLAALLVDKLEKAGETVTASPALNIFVVVLLIVAATIFYRIVVKGHGA